MGFVGWRHPPSNAHTRWQTCRLRTLGQWRWPVRMGGANSFSSAHTWVAGAVHCSRNLPSCESSVSRGRACDTSPGTSQRTRITRNTGKGPEFVRSRVISGQESGRRDDQGKGFVGPMPWLLRVHKPSGGAAPNCCWRRQGEQAATSGKQTVRRVAETSE